MNPNGFQSDYTVLIADDNRDTVEALSALLRIEAHHVIEAHCGPGGARAKPTMAPASISSNIGMPGLNGYEIASRIRRAPWVRQTILIAYSGWCRTEDRQRALTAGFDHEHAVERDSGATQQSGRRTWVWDSRGRSA
jgi:CheY-like chemotaxis protein